MRWRIAALYGLMLGMIAMAGSPQEGTGSDGFSRAGSKHQRAYALPKSIEDLNNSLPGEYLIGPGDLLDIQVWEQENLSGEQTVGPDGMISLPFAGFVQVEGKTRAQARELILAGFAEFYQDPVVSLQIKEYNNNRVFVLGRVGTPGVIRFQGRGSLLEALSKAGSLPTTGPVAQLTKCAVIRGRDQIIWIDVRELLGGNLGLNLMLWNGDVVYVPNEQDANVYVMGEVNRPGVYRLTTDMSFLDALMLAGGPTEDGRQNHMSLVRIVDGEARTIRVRQKDLRKGNLEGNVLLAENDIIFVGRKGVAHVNYVLEQLNPFASLLVISEALSNNED